MRWGFVTVPPLCAAIVMLACEANVEQPETVADAASNIVAVELAGVFEVDANALGEEAQGHDWNNIDFDNLTANAPSNGTLIAASFTAEPIVNTTIFAGGDKDTNEVTSWKHKNNTGGLPDKDNLTNAYAAAYDYDGRRYIAFGADRYAQDGDAQIGFWFFKNQVTALEDGTFDGVHAVGDLLILSDFTNGGDISTINVYAWVGSGGSDGPLNHLGGGTVDSDNVHFCVDLGGDEHHDACASINHSSTVTPWDYTPKSGPAGEFPTGGFYEGIIDVTTAFGGTGAPCFSSFMAETRSSQSLTATLKDFILDDFQTCAPSLDVTKTCSLALVEDSGKLAVQLTVSCEIKNTGNVALDITADDDGVSIPVGNLAAGASYDCSYTVFPDSLSDLVNFGHTDTVSATGTTVLLPGVEASDTATATCNLCPSCP